MAFCNKCLVYSERFSELLAVDQDSTPENEKPKEHFCVVFPEGIPEDIWNEKKKCPHMISKNEDK